MEQKDILKDTAEKVADALHNFYDQRLLDRTMNTTTTSLLLGEVVGYRKVKRPKYLWVTLPQIEKHYDTEYNEFEGYLLTFRRVRLFRIGTKMVSEPIYKKKTGSTIRFVRYGDGVEGLPKNQCTNCGAWVGDPLMEDHEKKCHTV